MDKCCDYRSAYNV